MVNSTEDGDRSTDTVVKRPPSFLSFPDAKSVTAIESFSSFPDVHKQPKASTSRHTLDDDDDDGEARGDRKKRRRADREHEERKHRKPRALIESDDHSKTTSEKRLDSLSATSGQLKPPTGRRRSREGRSSRSQECYNVPDLAKGETARLSKQWTNDSEDSDPALAQTADYKLFKRDAVGDNDIWKYGRTYRGNIPAYRRSGVGKLLGLQSVFNIPKDDSVTPSGLVVIAGRAPGKKRLLKDKQYLSRITDRHFKRLMLLQHTRDTDAKSNVFAGGARSTLPVDDDYIAIGSQNAACRAQTTVEHEDGQDYRSVQGFEKHTEDDADTGMDDVATEDGGESYDQYLKRRNIDFDRRLKGDPGDIEGWLQFSVFQDEVYGQVDREHGKGNVQVSTTQRRSLAEVKLSILEQGLDVQNRISDTPTPAALPLHLAILREGAFVWETSELMSRWQAALKLYSADFDIWREYLSFRQTTTQAFSVTDIVELYAECIARLVTALQNSTRGTAARSALEANALYALYRLCIMLRQAGYTERALAIFQAMMELNYFHPPEFPPEAVTSSPAVRTAALASLEDFWDGEQPRFGESDAAGWHSALSASTDASAVGAAAPLPQHPSSTSIDPFVTWGNTEAAAQQDCSRSARASDLDAPDPYSTVIFADIQPFLFSITSIDARYQLVYSFLAFLGLPMTPPDTSSATALAGDPFLHGEAFRTNAQEAAFWPAQTSEDFLASLVSFDAIDGHAMEPARQSAMSDPFSVPVRKFPLSPDVLYRNNPAWFCLIPQQEHLRQLDLPLIREVLAQARKVSKDSFLLLAQFSLEASLNPKKAIKLAKQELKADSRRLLLWDAYARIERSIGNTAAARKVYCTALQMSTSYTDNERVDVPLLWRAWAELEWEDGRNMACLAVLVASAAKDIDSVAWETLSSGEDEQMPLPPAVLRTRQHYRGCIDSANGPDASSSLFRHRISLVFALALLEYITTGIEAAQQVIQQQITLLRHEGLHSAEEEEAHALCAKLCYRHMQTATLFRPGLMRAGLENAIDHFPRNSIFLSLYLHNEARSRIENRVRGMLKRKVLHSKQAGAESWLFAIYAELHLNARQYNANAVRSLFEQATSIDKCRTSISLWSLFIDFEIKQGNTKRAKNLLRRALAECPWSKRLYMKAFSAPLRAAFKSGELREVYRLMLEKGIRLITEFDSVTAGYTSEISDEEEIDDTEDAMYAQLQAQERLKLMPM